MKIAFVFDDSLDKSGGIQEYMWSLREWLLSEGHDVHYIVGQTTRTDIPNVHSVARNVSVRFNGNNLSMSLFASTKKLRALLAEQQFDVLHVQAPYSPFMAGKVINLAPKDTAIIGTYHIAPYSALVTFGAYLQAIACARSLRKFSQVISVSTAAQAFARKTSRLQSIVVPDVIDYARFHNATPLNQYTDDVKTILFLGRLVERKGCGRLLQAIAQLQKSGVKLPPFRVVLCGAGPLENQLRSFVIEHELTEIVEFAGRISEAAKPHYYASADIAVFPANGGESLGIVLLEAMASGKAAVLGGDNPGYRTVLGGRPEQLFATTAPDELTAKLTNLLQNDAQRQAAAAWGMQESQKYEVSKVGQQIVELYRKFAPNSSNE